MIRNFMNWDLRNDGKNVQDVRGKINKSIVNVFSLFKSDICSYDECVQKIFKEKCKK